MRVVAGEAKGRHLQAPKGDATRPTSDRVREAIFDVLGSLGGVAGRGVADVFAGSGALGIEALSRGAAHAVLVDRAPAAVAAIRANLAATGLAERAEVVRDDVARWAARADPVDVLLCDPPYAFTGWEALLAAFWPLCDLAVLESAEAIAPGERWRVLREKRYGGTVVTVARPEPVSDRDQLGKVTREDRAVPGLIRPISQWASGDRRDGGQAV
jgi:16S rRNA (guanine966-N2)-methyltransferase